jgi:hypothetical protein
MSPKGRRAAALPVAAMATRRAVATATVLATLLLPVAAGTAGAKPEGAGTLRVTRFDSDDNCPLRRLDRQLVRCDNLTGGGVPAQLSVPEL